MIYADLEGINPQFRKRGTQTVESQVKVMVEYQVEKSEAKPILAWLSSDGKIEAIASDPVIGDLDKLVIPAFVAQVESLQYLIGTQPVIRLKSLEAVGLRVEVDLRSLMIRIYVSAELKKDSVLSLAGNDEPGLDQAIQPSELSGYVNTFANQNFAYGDLGGQDLRQPLRVSFDGALNFRRYVLEYGGDYTERESKALIRRDIRIVKDDEQNAIRYSVGDLNYPVFGYQSLLSQAGMSYATNFDVHPLQTFTPTAEHQIFLKSSSKIKVWVNDRKIAEIDAPKGPFNIRDLPLQYGENRFKLEIQDDAGRVEFVEFSEYGAASLLAPGLSSSVFAVGALARTDPVGDRSYDLSSPILSAFHRIGYSKNLTAFGYGQSMRAHIVVGGGMTWVNPLGTLDSGIALSRQVTGDVGAAMKTDFTLMSPAIQKSNAWSLSAGWDTTTASFARIGADTNGNLLKARHLLRFSASRGIGESTRFATGIRIGLPSPLTTAVSASVGRGWLPGLSSNLSLNLAKSESQNSLAWSTVLNANWAIPVKRQSMGVSYQFPEGRRSLNWGYNSKERIGGVAVNAQLNEGENSRSATVRMQHIRRRVELGFGQNYSRAQSTEPTSSKTNHISSLYASTAFAFVGTSFGMSRPISDSFLLVKPIKNQKNESIAIDPAGKDLSLGLADGFGPGFHPNLQSYRVRRVRIENENKRSNAYLPQNSFQVRPTFRSGVKVEVGTDEYLLVKGTLLHVDESPLSSVTLQVECLSDPKWTPRISFTNKKGRFVFEELKVGKFKITIFNHLHDPIYFEVPESANQDTIYTVGKILVK